MIWLGGTPNELPNNQFIWETAKKDIAIYVDGADFPQKFPPDGLLTKAPSLAMH